MNNSIQNRKVLKKMVELLELPESAYEKAKKRYEDLGEWFNRQESLVANNDPHIFPQGSFRLGTAIRPLDDNEEYDLDLACKLRKGITKKSHTQEELKELFGFELENYRITRGIKEKLESKHRCWRLLYQDDLNFHMDIVPCIPSDELLQKAIFNSLIEISMDERAAIGASKTTVDITDDRDHNFSNISESWKISNPEGYANWFISRMNQLQNQLLLNKAQVDSVPIYSRKTTLQRVIQLLKRHRDSWCKENPEVKPISVIITTLAARAYNGEAELSIALESILNKMGSLVMPTIPRVPNPVDPNEDFADRWYRPDSIHLQLETHFFNWLQKAQDDFKRIGIISDVNRLSEHIENRFTLKVALPELREDDPDSFNPPTHKTYYFKKEDVVTRPWKNMK